MKNILTMKYPSATLPDPMKEATPIGSGLVGGLHQGGVHQDKIMLSHSKLWRVGKTKKLPDVSHVLPKMRELILAGDIENSERLMADELVKSGYSDSTISQPLPLCDLDIIFNSSHSFSKYIRALDMERAESVISWCEGEKTFLKKAFVSRKNDTLFFKLTSNERCIDASFALNIHELATIGNLDLPQNICTLAKDEHIYFSATNNDGKNFGAVGKVFTNGKISYCDNKIKITDASEILIKVKVFIDGDVNKNFDELSLELDKLSTYDEELTSHEKLHKVLFDACSFSLSDKDYKKTNDELLDEAFYDECPEELLEKLWAFGRYLLICSNKEGSYPTQLYGLWTSDYNAIWAFNMLNINLQMIYWPALTTNMPKLMENVFSYISLFEDDYHENAKKLYNCRGINIPAVSTPESGLHKVLFPHVLHWTGAAGWLAFHYFDYYLITRDEEFLKNVALPFMYEASLFYEDFLCEDENGKLLFVPSNSPENTPAEFIEKVNKTPKEKLDKLATYHEVVANSTMDFAILKELLTNLIKGAKIVGAYKEKIPLWEKMLSKIPPYKINSDGAFAEWMSDSFSDNYYHRHESHLYPFFPGLEINRFSDEKLVDAIRVAVDKRSVIGLSAQSAWSLAFMANVYARLGDGKNAFYALDCLTKSTVLKNFFTVHNDLRKMGIASICAEGIPPIQIDANLGIVAAICEMLCSSNESEIFLFPALYKKWKKGNIGPLLLRTNTLCTLVWDEECAYVTLKQLNVDNKITLYLPSDMSFSDGEVKKEILLKSGEELKLTIEKNAKE